MCRTCQSAGDLDGFAVEVTHPTVPLAGPLLEASEPGGAGPGAPVPTPGPLTRALPPRFGGQSLVGTLRVDRGTGHLIISGDLYNDPPPVVDPGPDAPGVTL